MYYTNTYHQGAYQQALTPRIYIYTRAHRIQELHQYIPPGCNKGDEPLVAAFQHLGIEVRRSEVYDGVLAALAAHFCI